MPIFQSLLLLFIAVPLIEIYLLISVGGMIGAIPTIFIVLFTAVLGTLLLRSQGLYTLNRAQQQMQAGETPTQAMFEGILLLFSGALLLTPGFVTDAIGFLLLIPTVRSLLLLSLLKRLAGGQAQAGYYAYGQASGDTHASESRPKVRTNTIEGEYTKLDD